LSIKNELFLRLENILQAFEIVSDVDAQLVAFARIRVAFLLAVDPMIGMVVERRDGRAPRSLRVVIDAVAVENAVFEEGEVALALGRTRDYVVGAPVFVALLHSTPC
jgi:hypothetical protein